MLSTERGSDGSDFNTGLPLSLSRWRLSTLRNFCSLLQPPTRIRLSPEVTVPP